MQMARDAGMPMVMPDIFANSLRALEASEYAREQGKHEEFHRVVFRKYYGEGEDINRWEVLRAAAEEVGLDAEAMQCETKSGKYRPVLETHFVEAQAVGVSGIPTYIFNDKYAIVGAQSYEGFQRVMARLVAEAGESTLVEETK